MDYAKGLWSSFSDLQFDIKKIIHQQDGAAVMEWVMLGTNTGSFAGLPPTGQKIALQGIDIFFIQDDRIESVKGYFEKAMFSQQLGLNVVLQPRALGPFTFGTAVKSSSKNPNKPGFFTMTWIELKVEDDLNAFQQESLRVIQEAQWRGL